MHRMIAMVAAAVLSVVGFVLEASAQTAIFPVDTTTMGQVKTDLLAWATALIGVVLAVYAYRRVKAIIK